MSSLGKCPPYISEDWLTHSRGFAFVAEPPPRLANDSYLNRASPWEQVAGVTLQAQRGEFHNIDVLLDVANATIDVRLGLSSLRIFSHAAPSSLLPKISSAFDHPDYDIRIDSMTAPSVACDVSVVDPLIELIPHRSGEEREYLFTTLWDLLDTKRDDTSELIQLDADDGAQSKLARLMAQDFIAQHGKQTAILWGAPLDLSTLMQHIRALCSRSDFRDMGGVTDDLMSIFEAMTGISRAGCFTKECAPIPVEVFNVLNQFEQSGQVREFNPGQRYFFGHPIPR